MIYFTRKAQVCKTKQRSIASPYIKRRKKRINKKLLLFWFIWLGSRGSGTLGDLVNMTFLTLSKGKVMRPPSNPPPIHHFQARSCRGNMSEYIQGGVSLIAIHDNNDNYGEITKKARNKEMHSAHGNRAYSMMQINKGPSDFEKKFTEILEESKNIKLNFINICEANIRNKKW